ncbi:extracellular solute-binding protein [Streptomyces sp. NPDC056352]|uniref:extracellular solute-binding protein n=1 Tax=Streptomyces sp. NPDC056352 TaxID=3345791 RepID=UPI0035DB16D9
MRAWRSDQEPRAAGIGVLVPGLIASGCGGDGRGAGADGKVEIRYSWWGGQERAALINKTIALFEKKRPNIKVKRDFQDYENIWKKFNTQASAGNAPDDFQNSVAFLRTYDDKRVLLYLNSQVKAGNLGMENFRAGLGEGGRRQREAARCPGRRYHLRPCLQPGRVQEGRRHARGGMDLEAVRRGHQEDQRRRQAGR